MHGAEVAAEVLSEFCSSALNHVVCHKRKGAPCCGSPALSVLMLSVALHCFGGAAASGCCVPQRAATVGWWMLATHSRQL